MSYLYKTPEGLLPCPLCGGEAHLSVDPEGTRDINGRLWAYTVVCERCAATSGLTFSGKMAVDKWNRRAERTCRIIDNEDGHPSCSECGAHYLCMLDASYCPDCGARVVSK